MSIRFKGWQRASTFRGAIRGSLPQQGNANFIDEKAYALGANAYEKSQDRKLQQQKIDNSRIQNAALLALRQQTQSLAQAKDARDAVAAQDRHAQAEHMNQSQAAADQALGEMDPQQQSDILMHKWYGVPMQHQAAPMDPQTEQAFNQLPDEMKAALRLHKAFGMPLPTARGAAGNADPMKRPDVAPHIAAANQAQAMLKSAQAEQQAMEQEQTVRQQDPNDLLAPPTTIRTRVKRSDVSPDTYKAAQDKVAQAQAALEQHRRAALNALTQPADGAMPIGQPPVPGQAPAAPTGQQPAAQQQQPPQAQQQQQPQPQPAAQPAGQAPPANPNPQTANQSVGLTPGQATDPSRFGEVHVNPQTGQKAAFDNVQKMWVPVP